MTLMLVVALLPLVSVAMAVIVCGPVDAVVVSHGKVVRCGGKKGAKVDPVDLEL